VRRRAAALAAAAGLDEIVARFASDADASVRAAAKAATTEAAAPLREAPGSEKDPAFEAVHAVQAAIFGLTDTELAERIGVGESEAARLATDLVAQGRLARRGKRLVFAQGGAL
jgi:hypothetical protein